jgi:DNA polymerase-1
MTDATTLRERLPELPAAPQLGLDIETTGLDPYTSAVRLVQLATTSNRVLVVDAARVDPRLLAPVLAGAHRLVGHNLKFDLAHLTHAGLAVPEGERLRDTQLMAQLLGAGNPAGELQLCGLAAVAERVLGLRLDKTLQTADWSGALSEAQLRYAALDALVPLRLTDVLDPQLEEAGLAPVTLIEMRTLPALVAMELTGAPVDGALAQPGRGDGGGSGAAPPAAGRARARH